MTIRTWDEKRGVRTLTDEEFIQEFGEHHYRELMGPPTPPDPETMTEGRRALLDRMQAEQDVHEAYLARMRSAGSGRPPTPQV